MKFCLLGFFLIVLMINTVADAVNVISIYLSMYLSIIIAIVTVIVINFCLTRVY